jgi:hypothetical protein
VLHAPPISCELKSKVIIVPVLNYAPRHEDILGEWRYRSTHSLTLVLDGGEWSSSWAGRFTPRERAPGTHWIAGWVGPRTGLDTVSKRKIPRTPIIQPVVSCYTDWAILITWSLCIQIMYNLLNAFVMSYFICLNILLSSLLSSSLNGLYKLCEVSFFTIIHDGPYAEVSAPLL